MRPAKRSDPPSERRSRERPASERSERSPGSQRAKRAFPREPASAASVPPGNVPPRASGEPRGSYSARSALAGSIFVARRARDVRRKTSDHEEKHRDARRACRIRGRDLKASTSRDAPRRSRPRVQ